jgi:tryptophan-rich sensory protein
MRWALFTVPAVLGPGFLSGYGSGSGPVSPWFNALEKPGLYPPPATFGIVWSIFYVMMGVALALVIAARGAPGRGPAVIAFLVGFALNLSWSPVFFAMHRMSLALGIIGGMAVVTLVTIALFWRVRALAGALLLPYMAWICFAALLNYQILALNPQADGAPDPAPTVRIQL